MRVMFWAFRRFVVEFIEGLFHVARHGYVKISFGIVPGKGEAKLLCSFPIYGALVCVLDGCYSVVGVGFGEALDAEVVDA